jgi:hypothetical protein
MAALWVFQILLNVAFVFIAWNGLLYRRRIQRLEARLAILEGGKIQNSIAQPAMGASREPVIERKPIATTSLTEREAKPEAKRSRESMEAYEQASQLLARGVDPREIARKTGLSLSEVQLMGKVSQRSH